MNSSELDKASRGWGRVGLSERGGARYLRPDKLKQQQQQQQRTSNLIKLYGYNREEASVSSLAAYYEPASKVNCKKITREKETEPTETNTPTVRYSIHI